MLSPSNRATRPIPRRRRTSGAFRVTRPETAEPLKLSREVAPIEAAASAVVATTSARRESLCKLDATAGVVPTVIVAILRHARDVPARVSFHSGQMLASRALIGPRKSSGNLATWTRLFDHAVFAEGKLAEPAEAGATRGPALSANSRSPKRDFVLRKS